MINMTVAQNPRPLCNCADHKSVCRRIKISGLSLSHLSLDCHDTVPCLAHSLSTVCHDTYRPLSRTFTLNCVPCKKRHKGETAYSLRSAHLVKYVLRSKVDWGLCPFFIWTDKTHSPHSPRPGFLFVLCNFISYDFSNRSAAIWRQTSWALHASINRSLVPDRETKFWNVPSPLCV